LENLPPELGKWATAPRTLSRWAARRPVAALRPSADSAPAVRQAL
jgi:hypothetical protein